MIYITQGFSSCCYRDPTRKEPITSLPNTQLLCNHSELLHRPSLDVDSDTKYTHLPSTIRTLISIRIHFHNFLQRDAPFALLTTNSIVFSFLSATASLVLSFATARCRQKPRMASQYLILPVRRSFSSASFYAHLVASLETEANLQ